MKLVQGILVLILLGTICITPPGAASNEELLTGDIMNVQYEMAIAEIEYDDELQLFLADVPDSQTAIADHLDAVKTNPTDINGWIDLGKVQMKAKDWKEAENTFKKVTESDPENKDGWYGYLYSLYYLKKYDALLSQSQALIKQHPDWSYGHRFKGIALRNQEKYEEALQEYTIAIQIDPNDAGTWNNIGNVQRDLKRETDALEAYEKAIALDPDYIKAWNGKGNVLVDRGRYEEALTAFDTAIQLDPDYYKAWNGKGNALSGLQKYEEAIEAYDTCLSIDPEYTLAQNNRNIVMRKL